jgi:hypothetical protein
VRADELAAVPLTALQERNPQVDFSQTNDLMMGAASAVGEQGYNVGRNAALLAGIDHHVPATTVNRFCASSLQTIRMAFHAVKAGEGDQYVAAGVEAVSRFPAHAPFDPHPQLDGSDGAPYNVYIPMGITAENVAKRCKVSREAQDEWAAISQQRAVAAVDVGPEVPAAQLRIGVERGEVPAPLGVRDGDRHGGCAKSRPGGELTLEALDRGRRLLDDVQRGDHRDPQLAGYERPDQVGVLQVGVDHLRRGLLHRSRGSGRCLSIRAGRNEGGDGGAGQKVADHDTLSLCMFLARSRPKPNF